MPRAAAPALVVLPGSREKRPRGGLTTLPNPVLPAGMDRAGQDTKNQQDMLTLLRKEQSRSPGEVGGSNSGDRLRVKPWVPKVRKAIFLGPKREVTLPEPMATHPPTHNEI